MYPWYYVWSPDYRIFHEVLKFGTHDISGILLNPVGVPQSIFNRKTDNSGNHFLTGIGIKIYTLVKSLQLHPDQHIIFSDVDLIVLDKNIATKLKSYEVNDITAMREKKDGEEYNIGFMLVKSSPQVIDFFTKVLRRIHTEIKLDQDVFNEEIKNFQGTHGFFDTKDFIQSNMIRKDIWDTGNYAIIQCLSAVMSKREAILGKLATIVYFYNIKDLLHFLDKDIVLELREYFLVQNPVHWLISVDPASYSSSNELPKDS